jgi:hypothetical protein
MHSEPGSSGFDNLYQNSSFGYNSLETSVMALIAALSSGRSVGQAWTTFASSE